MEEIENTNVAFENIKHVDEENQEFWYAREISRVLEYTEWRNFVKVLNNAKEACKNSDNDIDNHFVEVNKMIEIAKGAKRKVIDYKLSRYACYLIVQNADPRKEVVALGQTYFAIQTRKQEINEKEYNELTEDEKRLYQRNLTKKGNYSLNQVAKNAGVKDFARTP